MHRFSEREPAGEATMRQQLSAVRGKCQDQKGTCRNRPVSRIRSSWKSESVEEGPFMAHFCPPLLPLGLLPWFGHFCPTPLTLPGPDPAPEGTTYSCQSWRHTPQARRRSDRLGDSSYAR